MQKGFCNIEINGIKKSFIRIDDDFLHFLIQIYEVSQIEDTSFLAFLYTMITGQSEALTNQRPSWGHRTHLWLVGDEKAHVSKFNFSRSRPDDFPSHFDAARKKLELYLNYPSIVPYLFLFLAQPALHSFYVRGSKYFWIILTSHHYSASGTTALPFLSAFTGGGRRSGG